MTAQSFADAINRDLNPGMQSPAVPFIIDVVGAQAVVDGKAKAASGVTVSGNKLIIKLTKPGADFLARISLPFFSAIPKNTPIDPTGLTTPIDAGPYYVKSWTKNRSAVIVKNPNYKGPRPHNIDQFVVTINTDLNQSFLQVKSGNPTSTPAASRPRRRPRSARSWASSSSRSPTRKPTTSRSTRARGASSPTSVPARR